jgi:hypothetical protein
MDVQEIGNRRPPIASTVELHGLRPAPERGGRTLITRFQEREPFRFCQWGHKLHQSRAQHK